MSEKEPTVDGLLVGAEDLLFYLGLVVILLGVSMGILWSTGLMGDQMLQNNARARAAAEERAAPRNQRHGPGNRRAAQVRNRRGRRVDDSESDGDGDRGGAAPRSNVSDDELDEKLNDPKLGAKKRAKLEAKAEKRAAREAEERMRDERKAKQVVEQKEREAREKEEADAEKRREEEEKRLREEKAQRELEEYMKMKEMFTVEGEGCEAPEDEDEGNLIEKFVDHIRAKKVILFEELATQFGLKVPDAIDRLTTLVREGRLTGVMDDRGKFIYISEEELSNVAKFIKQRGRVSIADLVENSANLITLTPDTQDSNNV